MKQRKPMNRISKKKVEELISAGKSIPASSFGVAKKLGKKKRGRRSIPTYHDGVLHGSQRQVLVYQQHELLQKAGEISHLQAEVDFTLDCPHGQVGMHRIDILFFDERKRVWQAYNVKADYEEAADALSNWKRRHWLKQYPTLQVEHGPDHFETVPTRYDFYFTDSEGGRVFFKNQDLIEAMGV